MSTRPRPVTALLLLALGCAPLAPAPGPTPAPAPRIVGASPAALAQADSVRRSFTAADVAFMTGMIGHHAQAITMSHWAPTHGASPALLRLTERIINAQQDEIATMQTWLRDRQLPVPDPMVGHDMAMMGHAHDGMPMMPGMLTPAQMAELEAARGPAFDQLFLRYMIQHHRGALTMVETLFGSQGAGQEDLIFKLASDVHTDQVTEIARMERMLAELASAAPPAP